MPPADDVPAERVRPPGALEPIADGTRRELDPRWVTLRRATGGIAAAIATVALSGSAVAAGLLALSPGSLRTILLTGAGVLAVLLLARAWWWPPVSYRHRWYAVDETSIEIGRGVLWRVVVSVPRSRVQHTDVSQGPLERRFGLGTLVIYTAGTEHSRVSLSGLDEATASRVRDHLLPTDEADAV